MVTPKYKSEARRFSRYFGEEEQTDMLFLSHSSVWSVSNFIVLAPTYLVGWPVLSIAVWSSYWHCTVGVLFRAELDAAGINISTLSEEMNLNSPAR